MTTIKFKLNATEFIDLVPQMGGCFATDKITVEGLKVGYMYREEPDDESDSGWRFFSGTETQPLTKCKCHKGFRGMRRSEVRFNFSCNLIGNHPQSLTALTLDR